MINVFQFGADIADFRREIEGLEHADRPARFLDRARELVRWHTVKGVDKQEVIDRLAGIGAAVGIDTNKANAAITEAFAHPFEPEPTKISNGTKLRLTLFNSIDPSPRKSWLIGDLLGEAEVSCLFGAPGSGKSVLAGDMAAHVAAGKDWLGRPVSQGSVLYIAAERASLVKRRFAAWRKFHNIDDIPLGVLDGTIDLRSSKDTTEEIIAHARDMREKTSVPVKFIVIDTTSRALNGGDENSSKDTGALVANVEAIRTEAAVYIMLVHHIPIAGKLRLRGHSSLLGAVDTTIAVEAQTGGRTATVDKVNDGPEGEAVSFSLESVEISVAEEGKATTAPVVVGIDPIASQPKSKQRPTDKARLALSALDEAILSAGQPVPTTFGLPGIVKAVSRDTWRDELLRRGVIPSDDKNKRATFNRIRDQLAARELIGERDGLVWKVASSEM